MRHTQWGLLNLPGNFTNNGSEGGSYCKVTPLIAWSIIGGAGGRIEAIYLTNIEVAGNTTANTHAYSLTSDNAYPRVYTSYDKNAAFWYRYLGVGY